MASSRELFGGGGDPREKLGVYLWEKILGGAALEYLPEGSFSLESC